MIVVDLFFGTLALGGWILYFRERERSRDYATDLSQLIHDHDLGRDDLRRSLAWDEIEERVERQQQ
ncbi:hypothetical protein [Haloplanus sp. C73]|uniref:hypothetical protein n=1 Tax=Haloplanus sp. C73 TaxID=3421641 RepID=UPI003EBF0E7F